MVAEATQSDGRDSIDDTRGFGANDLRAILGILLIVLMPHVVLFTTLYSYLYIIVISETFIFISDLYN